MKGGLNMKIVDLKTFIVGNPWKNWVFCKIYTDEGVEGLGEATGGLATLPIEAALREIKPLVMGENPLDLPALRDKIRKALYLPESSAQSHALSGIDAACWDIIGKKYNIPLYRLLGGKARPKLRAYANGWYRGERTPEFFGQRASEVVKLGYTAVKFDPFGTNYRRIDRTEEDLAVEIVAAVREAVGDHVDLLIECHDRFSVTTAIRLADRLKEYNPMWMETPVLSTDIPATNAVARKIDIPVATGERFGTLRQFTELLQDKSVDIIQPEFLGLGGITPLVEAFHIAEGFGVDVAPHNAQSPFCSAVNVHVGISRSNFLIQECFDDFQERGLEKVLTGVPRVVDGYIEPSDTPGIGVDLNEAEAEKYPYGPQNFLRLFEQGWEKRGGASERDER
jgi:galactonate dehydratase